ncbi:unnamed protein product [Adineta ricciae]|uniref:Uncharacterized protein n=1 Tax=Adineta ricciae TaxID=249248 RepID=A0A815SDB0_ADIRI|nr:unnamed protein product [Adineta ricciae]
MHKLHSRLKRKYFGQNTGDLLDSVGLRAKQKLLDSFTAYIQNIIGYANKYYDEHRSLCESVSVLGIVDLDQITFNKIVTCVNALKIKVDLDMLFDELIILQSIYKDLKQYRETIFEQVRVFINPKLTEEITDGKGEWIIDDDTIAIVTTITDGFSTKRTEKICIFVQIWF